MMCVAVDSSLNEALVSGGMKGGQVKLWNVFFEYKFQLASMAVCCNNNLNHFILVYNNYFN